MRYASEAMGAFQDALWDFPKNLNVWLEFGTMLGAYRERGLIPHDADIDLGVENSKDLPDLISHLARGHFSRVRHFRLHSTDPSLADRIVEYTVSYYGLVSIDLFVLDVNGEGQVRFFNFDAEPGLNWRQTLAKYGGRLRVYAKLLQPFALDKIEFLGRWWNIPSNIHEHLVELYGPDYQTPKAYSYAERPKDREVMLAVSTLGELIVAK